MTTPIQKNFGPQEIFMAHTIRTTNAAESGPHAQLGAYWRNFFPQHGANIAPNSLVFAVYTGYELPFNVMTSEYDFFCGMSNPQGKSSLTPFTIPADKYLVFKGKGEMPQTIITTWQAIWAYFSQPQEHERAFGVDFQLHNPTTPDEVEIYISVK